MTRCVCTGMCMCNSLLESSHYMEQPWSWDRRKKDLRSLMLGLDTSTWKTHGFCSRFLGKNKSHSQVWHQWDGTVYFIFLPREEYRVFSNCKVVYHNDYLRKQFVWQIFEDASVTVTGRELYKEACFFCQLFSLQV